MLAPAAGSSLRAMTPARTAASWRRLIVTSFALFLVVLAFLAARVRSGSDPALRASATPAAVTQTASAGTSSQSSQSSAATTQSSPSTDIPTTSSS